jgi:hypothetical protein
VRDSPGSPVQQATLVSALAAVPRWGGAAAATAAGASGRRKQDAAFARQQWVRSQDAMRTVVRIFYDGIYGASSAPCSTSGG